MDNQNTYCSTTTTTNFRQPLVLQNQVIGDYHLLDQSHHDDEKAETSRRFTMFDTNVRYKSPQNPRKKRSKLLRISDNNSLRIGSTSGVRSVAVTTTKPKCSKKPADPSAPKITRHCTECGKKFLSWKALFGHMRCHPERQWRGINPPPNLKRQIHSSFAPNSLSISDEDHEIAQCLLLLANGPDDDRLENVHQLVMDEGVEGKGVDESGTLSSGLNYNCCKFECSSCKKVFGSHQALGGHRATHKNVKGCFANTRSYEECSQQLGVLEEASNMGITWPLETGRGSDNEDITSNDNKRLMVLGHKCSICLRVFSSGQALGGHKRCHWEDETTTTTTIAESDLTRAVITNVNIPKEQENSIANNLDLNFPPVTISRKDHDDSSASYSSIPGLELDLRLGL